jgi:hypothetical protein
MLYINFKFEIDINNDDLLETVWEHMREIKRGRGREYYCINKVPSPLPLFLSFFFTF